MAVLKVKNEFYSKLYMDLFRPAMELRKPENERIFEHFRFLKKSERWSKEKLRKLQIIRLKKILNHAYSNVPYYHTTFKKLGIKPTDIKKIEDLSKLPILTKKVVRTSLDDLLAKNIKDMITPYSTGGSTGEPLKFYIDKTMISWGSAARLRAWEWCKYRVGEKCALLWGSHLDLDLLRSFRGKFSTFVENSIILNAFNMSEDNMITFAKKLKKFKPKVLRAYTSAMYIFAKFVKDNNIKGIEPKAIITTAENLYDHWRRTIEETFGCKVYDGYGSRETSLIAHECEANDGYHISDENSIVEFIKDGEAVSPGESGEMIITDLHNMVMPWIRFKIEDLGTPTDEKCSCGRALSRIKSINGRILDTVVTKNGKYIHGGYFQILLEEETDWIKRFQVVQKKIDKILIKIVPKNEVLNSEIDRIRNSIKEHTEGQLKVEFKITKSIKVSPSGKRRLVVSEILKD